MLGERLIKLRNLVALGQVRIKIVLARKNGGLTHLAIQGLGRAHGKLHRSLIQHRQRAGQSQAYGADVGIRRRAKLCGAAAKNLGLRQKLDVHFQPDHRLVFLA